MNLSEHGIASSYIEWKTFMGIDDRFSFLESYNLHYMTTPTSSYLNKFIIAKITKTNIHQFKTYLDKNSSNVVMYDCKYNELDESQHTFIYAKLDCTGVDTMKYNSYHKDGTLPKQTHHCFVFGSNLAGIHGAGAARIAHDIFNRPYGNGIGYYVSENLQSSFAIPTKDENIQTMRLSEIIPYVKEFIQFVTNNPQKQFFITRIGCGLAGYQDHVIAPLFSDLNGYMNVSFAEEWKEYIEKDYSEYE